MPALVSSPKELYLTLQHRPISWATAIAFRIAARAFPAAADCLQPDNENGSGSTVLAVFRALVLVRGVMRFPKPLHRNMAERLGERTYHVPPLAAHGRAAWQCTFSALQMIGITSDQMAVLGNAAYSGADTASQISGKTEEYWLSITEDVNALFEQQSAEWLLRQPLWLRYGDNYHVELYFAQIREFEDAGLSTICAFYDALLSGNDGLFPGFNEQADREFFQRFIATDDTWWNRTPADVGRDLADWVAELAIAPSPEHVASPMIPVILHERPLVLMEGETDPKYIIQAAKIFGRQDILEKCDIHWVGDKNEQGQVYNTGAKGLDHTLNTLRSNPSLSQRRVLFLYDNDCNKPNEDHGNHQVHSIPKNSNNNICKNGIENLLHPNCFTEEFWQTSNNRRTLRKMFLCNYMCIHGTEFQFSAFAEVLENIQDFISTEPPEDECNMQNS